VAVHAPDGTLIATHAVGAPQPSCPAFGGPALGTLYVTTAHEGMDAPARAAHPLSGQVFALRGAGTGLPEPKVLA
jgi:sugar lactone lactonase YvrE